jgi:hypothetical protein
MDNDLDGHNPVAPDEPHPLIYKVLAGLAIWLVVSAWIFFFQAGYLGLDLGVVSGLVLMLIAIPAAIYHASRGFQFGHWASGGDRRFRTWISGDFDTEQGRRRSAGAAIEILLPMAAAVFGITAIGIVFRLTEIASYAR